jgi:hypothetical protein
VAFLAEVVSLCSPRQQIHIILDNLSAHKTQLVRDFLQQHPRVQLHFTLRIPLGSTKSSFGSPRSNVRSLPAASSPLYLTWLANFVVTSTPTLPTLARSSRNTPTLLGAYVLTNSLRQATSALAPVVRLHREFQHLLVQLGQERGETCLPHVLNDRAGPLQQVLTFRKDSRRFVLSDARDLLPITPAISACGIRHFGTSFPGDLMVPALWGYEDCPTMNGTL